MDFSWEIDKGVPRRAASVDDVIIFIEDSSGQMVLAQVFPDIFLRIEFGTAGREAQESDVVGHFQFSRGVPARAVDKDDGVCAFPHMGAYCFQMKLHGVCVRVGQDESDPYIAVGADRAKDIGVFVPLVDRHARP